MDARRRVKVRAQLRNTCELADDVDEGEDVLSSSPVMALAWW
jgi:hypothetical protein